MAGYISELHYDGAKSIDFFEIAVPAGTDTSGYTLALYDGGGNNYNTFALGAPVTTEAGSASTRNANASTIRCR